MAKTCGAGALKCLILTINTIMFLLGLCLAAVSGYTAFNKDSILHQLIYGAKIHNAMTGIYILFAVGIVMAFVSILGCIGAANENRLLLWINFFFILLIFIMELVATILCFYKYKSVERDVLKTIKESSYVAANDTSVLAGLRSVLSSIESHRKCCGLHGPQDYGNRIPQSCYAVTTKSSSHGTKKSSSDAESNDAPIESGGELANDPVRAFEPPSSSSSTISSTTTTPSTSTSTTPPTSTSTTPPTSTSTTPPTSTSTSTTTMPTTLPTTTETPTTTLAASPSTSTTTGTTTLATPITSSSTTEPIPVLNTTVQTTMASEVGTTQGNLNETTLATTAGGSGSKGSKTNGHPYTVGCAAKLQPIVYAAGGIAIAILVLELLLLIFIGCLLCEIGSGYESLA